VLPDTNGSGGSPAELFIRSNTNETDQALTFTGGANGILSTRSTGNGESTDQEWFFERLGYAGLSTPASAQLISWGAPASLRQAVPVYMIITMTDPDFGPQCLDAKPGLGSVATVDLCTGSTGRLARG
jgi:hypothetical protein